ncbi:ABC transporter substrate-binding protein [Roseomonas sp. SSH11]|uniref:Thiamine pyrimidine synthase n=1 Tax=Pararoseomonas baculiformis TaxID=2820812 RepID=A0ABS4A9P5_9PROT|nr:ABC transporter substrate-binding protein [Pararoseomonas baculiformis]MBP0443705.1 ABC transporter substrate-binding protein [Pararoseomonas baculiformis]
MQIIGRRTALGLGAGLLAAPRLSLAQAPQRVKFTLDWVPHGAYAFAVAAERNGIFRKYNLEMPVNRGYGSGRVPVDVAAGTYELGFGDLTPQLRFMAENPDRGLVCVAVLYDRSPLSATVRADGPIRDPKQLAGKTLAAPEFDSGRQMFPVYAQAIGIDPASVNWMSVSPELREPMLVQRRADGITGFVTSTALSLKALGMDLPQQRVFYYRDAGMDFYGSGLVTTRAVLREKPEAIRAAVAALIEGMVFAYRNPAEAINLLKAREALTDVPIETERQKLVFEQMLVSENVRQHGLSHVEPGRLKRQIDAVVDTFKIANRPTPEQAYTDEFLPPPAARML